MCYKNNYIDKYVREKSAELNVSNIIRNTKLDRCGAVTYIYKGKYNIVINSMLSEKEQLFGILHELSHIELGLIGKKYEKKASGSISEKIVNFNLVRNNKNIISNNSMELYFWAIVSERELIKKIKFIGGEEHV